MRRARVLGLALLLAAALLAWFVLRGWGGAAPLESGGERGAPSPEPPTSPMLVGGGAPRESVGAGSAARAGQASEREMATVEVVLQYPDGLDKASIVSLSLLASSESGLRFAWWLGGQDLPPSPSTLAAVVTLERERSEPGARSERLRLLGVPVGSHLLEVGVSTQGKMAAASIPVRIDVPKGGMAVEVHVIDLAEFATLAFRVWDGDDPLESARLQIHVNGSHRPSVSTDASGRCEARVPGATVITTWVDAFTGMEELTVPPPRTLRVAPRERHEIEFRIENTVPVRIRTVGPDGADVEGGGLSLWRFPAGQRPRYAGDLRRQAGDWRSFRLPPDEYGVQAGATGELGQAWQRFTVVAGSPLVVTVPMGPSGARARLHILGESGVEGWGGAVSLGLLPEAAPESLAYANLGLDAEGRAVTAPMPDGEYRLTLRRLSRYRRVRVDRGEHEIEVSLPAPTDPLQQGSVRGSCLYAEDGRPGGRELIQVEVAGEAWGWMATERGGGDYRVEGLPAGEVVVRVEPTPWTRLAIRPYEARVRIVAGQETVHDIRLVR